MSYLLYHFFPHRFAGVDETISTVNSILKNGFYLNKEIRRVDWEDKYKVRNIERSLEAEQYRFCLTAISNDKELVEHSNIFGFIGFAFDKECVLKMGGFPVFYVPTPNKANASIEEYKGVSLLYRLAENQEILEYLHRNNILHITDIDIENVLGAVKFLANIFYPTQGSADSNAKSNYYEQREWRIIHNLTSENLQVGSHNNNYTIETLNNKPIREFIRKIVVFKPENVAPIDYYNIITRIQNLMQECSLTCELQIRD